MIGWVSTTIARRILRYPLRYSRKIVSHSMLTVRPLHLTRTLLDLQQINPGDKDPIEHNASPYENVDIQAIAEGDPETEKQLKLIILEVDVFRQDGNYVPDQISENSWRELLSLPSRSSRLRYLKFLFKNEKKAENREAKAKEKRAERASLQEAEKQNNHIIYGFRGSTLFLRIYDTTMDAYLHKNLMNAALFSQHLVFDCSYDKHMTNIEARNCARQLCITFSDNRNHIQPFHIVYCNVDPTSVCMQALHRYIPPMYDKEFPIFTTPKSYLDIYPKERLVYLTPHCREPLYEWNHDDIYIVGAFVDKSCPKPISLAKAKEQGLRMARLPLERHLVWGTGATKNLTLNQMGNILLDMRHTGDWKTAFQHIPRRKVITSEDLQQPNDYEIKRTPGRQAIRALQGQKDVHLSNNMIKRIRNKNSNFYD